MPKLPEQSTARSVDAFMDEKNGVGMYYMSRVKCSA
jgi:hypothetical protein